MAPSLDDPLATRIAEFLAAIGLPVRVGEVPQASFLPGITIEAGELVIDQARLLYPGDLLHEAGHLAVLPPSARLGIQGDAGDDAGLEIGAIAWSYAAALHLGIDPAVVFHPAGYRGGAGTIVENFAAGRFIGVPILEWAGLTATGERAATSGVPPYPAMMKWLRDE